jgi:hypothetical protein
MIARLTPQEESYVQELLSSRSQGISTLAITANLLLLIGGFMIVCTALFLAQHLTDAVVYSVGLPNFVGGILIIVGYVFVSRRVAQMKRLNSILSKLSS